MNNLFHFFDRFGLIPIDPPVRIEKNAIDRAIKIAVTTNREITLKQNSSDKTVILIWTITSDGSVSKERKSRK